MSLFRWQRVPRSRYVRRGRRSRIHPESAGQIGRTKAPGRRPYLSPAADLGHGGMLSRCILGATLWFAPRTEIRPSSGSTALDSSRAQTAAATLRPINDDCRKETARPPCRRKMHRCSTTV
ncbi:MAG: hypothetical protein ACLUN5_17260 [Oscillospiraceae bacterium]